MGMGATVAQVWGRRVGLAAMLLCACNGPEGEPVGADAAVGQGKADAGDADRCTQDAGDCAASCRQADDCGDHGRCVDESESPDGPHCRCDRGYAGSRCDACATGFQADSEADDGDRRCVERATVACSDGGAQDCGCAEVGRDGRCEKCQRDMQDRNGDGRCDPTCEAAELDCGDHGRCTDALGPPRCRCNAGHDGPACRRCAAGYQDADSDGTCEPDCATAYPNGCGSFGRCIEASGVATCRCQDSARACDDPGCCPVAQQLAVGQRFSCVALANAAVHCFGENVWGQVGTALSTAETRPVAGPAFDSEVRMLSGGEQHSCAALASGEMHCWGFNNSGQLGVDKDSHSVTPVQVPIELSTTAPSIAGGWLHTCAVTAAGAARCWGYNDRGQLGDGTMERRGAPVDVVGLSSGVVVVAAGNHNSGERHGCALMATGGVRCWGENPHGQLGNGERASLATSPVDVAGLDSGVSAIAVGNGFSCAIVGDPGAAGALWCWGQITDSTEPVPMEGMASGVRSVAASGGQLCVINEDGDAACRGNNRDGQLGNGTRDEVEGWSRVSALEGRVAQIAPSNAHTCALTEEGEVFCWGSRAGGALGDGLVQPAQPTPTRVRF